MPEQLFVFLQFEFPWALGPSDGRYLQRDGPDGKAEWVVVVETLSAGQPVPGDAEGRRGGRLFGRGSSRRRERDAPPEPAPTEIQTTRVTVVDPVPLSAEGQARAWLEELDRERDVTAGAAVVNRVVHLHRIAAADPYVREVSPPQALVIRAGWGEGEQVAYGMWRHARELALPRRRRGRGRDRSWALRPQERLAALLGGRADTLLCEELALRARLDLDQGRPAHAAVGLERALAAASGELGAEGRQDLALRISELEQLRAPVAELAKEALAQAASSAAGEPGAGGPSSANGASGLDEELLEHALGRLEAALRARTATGV